MKNTITVIFLALLMLGVLAVLGPVDQEPERVAKDECSWTKQTDGSEICR